MSFSVAAMRSRPISPPGSLRIGGSFRAVRRRGGTIMVDSN
jgi:hypothetical protein